MILVVTIRLTTAEMAMGKINARHSFLFVQVQGIPLCHNPNSQLHILKTHSANQ
jgi:hypothetical protein